MPQNSMRKNIFWLLWTISLTRMGLLIWSGAYFQTETLAHTSRPLMGLCVPSLFTPASKCIQPCIKAYSPLHQSLFTAASKFIQPCIKFYSPLHQSLFTPKCTQNGTKKPGSGQEVWPNVLACKKDPYQINKLILVKEMVQNNKKIVFLCCLGAFGHPQMYSKWYSKTREWERCQ